MTKSTNQHGFRLHRKHDKDLIEELNKYPNEEMDKSERIKDLLRKGLQFERMQQGQMSPPSAHLYHPYQYQQVPFYYTIPQQFTQAPPQNSAVHVPQAPEMNQQIQQPAQTVQPEPVPQPEPVTEPVKPLQKEPEPQQPPQIQQPEPKKEPEIKVEPPKQQKPITPPPPPVTPTTGPMEMDDFEFDLPEIDEPIDLELEPKKPEKSLDELKKRALSNFLDD